MIRYSKEKNIFQKLFAHKAHTQFDHIIYIRVSFFHFSYLSWFKQFTIKNKLFYVDWNSWI